MQAGTDSQRVSTGIAELDRLLQGGFLRGRSYLVAGDAGTGKTTLCIQFLLAGLRHNEKAIYVTVDERPAEILQSAASLGWNLQNYIQDKSLVILDASPYFSGRAAAIAEKGVDLPKIIADLATYGRRMEAKRLVIDPMTPLILSADSPIRIQEQARALIHLLQTQLTTTNLFSSQLPGRTEHDLTVGIEEFLASGVLLLKVGLTNGRYTRSLYIKKMRGTSVEPREYPITIAPERGIAFDGVEPAPPLQPEPNIEALEFFQLPKDES
ncbi:MAG TPA: ATPase domain-containing protein [candidate division Zixibacteria bacterium]|nr:ATPase domain-containing protein [candidate division Zixibacteria bacterium]